jgi:L-ascorbate metabolism protein UlaG (beta-lactamase superfamily)
MVRLKLQRAEHRIRQSLVVLLAIVVCLLLILSLLWRDRVDLDAIGLPPAPVADVDSDAVTITWFGVSTLLFDDGETQILIDGFISRPDIVDILRQRRVDSDAATINYFLNEYGVENLAAIVPVHSHFDHAMDIGAIANRSSASILGSASTAAIARGSNVPEDQIVIVDGDSEFDFGLFTVRLIPGNHAPVGWSGSVPLPGTIDEPLALPAPVSAFREGGSYSIVVSHPRGKALVQGSAGMAAGALDKVRVDTVFLGVGMLESLGREYIADYWRTTVTSTGAKTVVPVHFDDYTMPFGRIVLAPKLVDDFSVTVRLLKELRNTWDQDTRILLPTFAEPMPLQPGPAPEI